MFISELMLETNALTYKPSEEDFQVSFTNRYELFYKFLFFTNLKSIYGILLVDSYRRPLQR